MVVLLLFGQLDLVLDCVLPLLNIVQIAPPFFQFSFLLLDLRVELLDIFLVSLVLLLNLIVFVSLVPRNIHIVHFLLLDLFLAFL